MILLSSFSPSRRFLTVVALATAGELAGQSESTHLQAAAVVHGGLQGYPGDKDPVISVDAVALAYVEAEGLSRSFDYLDEVDGVLRILKGRSPANFLNSCRRDISLSVLARAPPGENYAVQNCFVVMKIIFSRARVTQMRPWCKQIVTLVRLTA